MGFLKALQEIVIVFRRSGVINYAETGGELSFSGMRRTVRNQLNIAGANNECPKDCMLVIFQVSNGLIQYWLHISFYPTNTQT
jgi:hypothetical protein